MPRAKTIVAPRVRASAVAAYKGGASLAETALAAGLSVWITDRVLKEEGVERRAVRVPKISDPDIRSTIVKRYKFGESASWLAECHDCSDECIAKIIRDSGVEIRTRDKARAYGLQWSDRKGRMFYMRSSWEVKTGHWLDLQGVDWDYEIETFDIGKGRSYLPDFWLYAEDGSLDKIIDVKGRWTERAITSIAMFRKQNPQILFEVWEKKQLDKRGILELHPPRVERGSNAPRFRMRRKLRKRIIVLHETGLSAKEVGELVGRSAGSIKGFLKKAGRSRTTSQTRLSRIPKEKRDKLARLYSSGMTIAAAASSTGFTTGTAYDELKRRGVLRKQPLFDKREIVRRYKCGESAPQIATQLGCSEALVYPAIRKARITPHNRRGLSEHQRTQIQALRSDGMTYSKISELTNVSRSVVFRSLKQENSIRA